MTDTPEAIQDEIKKLSDEIKGLEDHGIKKLSHDIDMLEDRVRKLQLKNVAETVVPSDDHNFLKQTIDTEIRMLELAYKGLRDLVIGLQDRQKALYVELQEANKKLEETLTQKISTVKSDLNTNINGVNLGLNTNINTVKSDLNTFKGEMSQKNSKMQTDYDKLKKNKEDSLRVIANYVNQLAIITRANQEMTQFGLDGSMKKLERYGSI